jgi:hypothetical protein
MTIDRTPAIPPQALVDAPPFAGLSSASVQAIAEAMER